jgi:hypothetical protein
MSPGKPRGGFRKQISIVALATCAVLKSFTVDAKNPSAGTLEFGGESRPADEGVSQLSAEHCSPEYFGTVLTWPAQQEVILLPEVIDGITNAEVPTCWIPSVTVSDEPMFRTLAASGALLNAIGVPDGVEVLAIEALDGVAFLRSVISMRRLVVRSEDGSLTQIGVFSKASYAAEVESRARYNADDSAERPPIVMLPTDPEDPCTFEASATVTDGVTIIAFDSSRTWQQMRDCHGFRIIPRYTAGEFVGFRIAGGRRSWLASQLDLRNGDIITSINGEPTGSRDDAARYVDAMDNLVPGEDLAITVLRGGDESVTVTFRLAD